MNRFSSPSAQHHRRRASTPEKALESSSLSIPSLSRSSSSPRACSTRNYPSRRLYRCTSTRATKLESVSFGLKPPNTNVSVSRSANLLRLVLFPPSSLTLFQNGRFPRGTNLVSRVHIRDATFRRVLFAARRRRRLSTFLPSSSQS